MLAAVAALFAVVAASVGAHPLSETSAGLLPGRWYREPGSHPVHKLFARQSGFPAVGSPEWTKKYPPGKLSPSQTPQAWTDALNAAVSAGLIPTNCPVASAAGTYSNSSGTMNPFREPICSSAAQCKSADQTYDVPDGLVALSFDDGPLPASKQLHAFCRQNNQRVTHFYIGGNILGNPDMFQEAYSVNGDDMAVHTWSHPHMPQLSNEMVLAELGWTMQIIHDSTNGRLPMYWRPPYGESDNRVRAIAKNVFGLHTVIWNGDTNDWKIGQGQTLAAAKAVLTKAYSGPKSPGLNILEHELTAQTVQLFMDTYPLIKQNGWTAKSIPEVLGTAWYLNAADNSSPVTDRPVAGGSNSTASPGGGSSAGGGAASSGTNSATSVGPTATSQPSASNAARGLVASSVAVGMIAVLGSALVL
ncbi:hypothetical protein FRC10_011396 [Ceratobasidium sp. 414]|nr:hypothetical protein FRC10_011396 [Ceratobasidium sp. 414]